MAAVRWLACAIAIGLGSAGCYESSFPIDPAPQLDLDSRVVGGWRCMFAEPDANNVFSMEVKASEDRTYQIRTMVAGGNVGHYAAYGSRVNGSAVINVKVLDADAGEKPWVFLRYELVQPHLLFVRAVDEEAMKGVEETPAAARRAFEQAKNDSGMFQDAFVCLRLN